MWATKISLGPQLPTVLRSLWIDLKRKVVNLSYIVRAPESNLIVADLTSLPLILNERAPKHVITDFKVKPGPTLV